jgi:motility quorum-sensing regulator/GCU-specific mRNA interferase toxin
MEKRKPHYPLPEVKACILAGQFRATTLAVKGAAALGFDMDGMQAVIAGLTMRDFYKSMTTYKNNHIWQDVYRPQTQAGKIYLKLTILNGLLIVSFKESEL